MVMNQQPVLQTYVGSALELVNRENRGRNKEGSGNRVGVAWGLSTPCNTEGFACMYYSVLRRKGRGERHSRTREWSQADPDLR